jgi:hypothetical protein
MRPQLTLPDAERCQSGVGAVAHVQRCANRSAYVVTSTHPRADGGYDTFAVCATCLQVLSTRFGAGAFNIITIED